MNQRERDRSGRGKTKGAAGEVDHISGKHMDEAQEPKNEAGTPAEPEEKEESLHEALKRAVLHPKKRRKLLQKLVTKTVQGAARQRKNQPGWEMQTLIACLGNQLTPEELHVQLTHQQLFQPFRLVLGYYNRPELYKEFLGPMAGVAFRHFPELEITGTDAETGERYPWTTSGELGFDDLQRLSRPSVAPTLPA